MASIPVTKIIDIENPKKFKLHAARWNGDDNPLDVYVRSKDEWFGWNSWRHEKDEFSRQYIFSLIDFYHETNMWLFGGIYEVLKRENFQGRDGYKIEEVCQYSDYVGRLKIKMERPARGRAFYLEKHLETMIVSEILRRPYSGEAFPGYENINHDFHALVPIFKNEVAGWKAALESVKGVYVVMDKSNGKKYVGSAYSTSGVWSRWGCYIGTGGHAWNDELEKIIKKEGREYAQENFRIALLEYRPMKVDDSVIHNRETYWKEVFLSRGKFGYNQN